MQSAIKYIMHFDDAGLTSQKAPETGGEDVSETKIKIPGQKCTTNSGNHYLEGAADDFFRYLTSVSKPTAVSFWRSQLDENEAVVFPFLPPTIHQPRLDSSVYHKTTELQWSLTGPTASTRVRAAWAILQATYTDSSEAVFGTILTDHRVLGSRDERKAGYPVGIVPLCIIVKENSSIDELSRRIQSQTEEMTPFAQTGLRQIRHVSAGAERACQFQTLLVIRPTNQDAEKESAQSGQVKEDDNGKEKGKANETPHTCAIVIDCELRQRDIAIRIDFDSAVIEAGKANKIALQLDKTIRQLCSASSKVLKLADICTVSEQDLQDIWGWNATVPKAVEAYVHDLIADRARKQPEAPAICAWDGELTYGELDALSTRLAYRLVELGVTPGQIVPLCFEKSIWTPVAMLGVMKAGAASVALDLALPEERLRVIVGQVIPSIIVSSAANKMMAHRLADNHMVVVAEKQCRASPSRLHYAQMA